MAQTPVGVFKFCHLNKPDTKFNEDGEFNVSVVLDADEPAVKKLVAALEKEHAKAVTAGEEGWSEIPTPAKKKLAARGIKQLICLPFFEDEYDENDQPTGNIVMRFKTKAKFTDRKTGKTNDKIVPFVDGRGQTIPTNKRPLVYGGTTGRIDFTPRAYFLAATGTCGISLYLNKVQIATLVSSGGGGFDEIEGSGFSADDLDEYTPQENGSGGESSGGIDDDLDADLDSGNDSVDDIDDEIPF